jgi:subtilase family serine protease
MQLNACFNSTDCAYVIFNIEDTGDYQEMANAALDLCTQDGYSCSDELDELTSCMLSSPNCGAATTTTSTTTTTTTTTTTSPMDTTEMMSTEMTDEPATSEGDDGTSAAARVYQVMAMLITFGMMMIAF